MFAKFFKAMFSELGSGMSGALSVPFTIAALWSSSVTQRWLYLCLAFVCVYVSAYRIWAGEHAERVKAERVRDEVLDKDRPEVFALLNFGPRAGNNGEETRVTLSNKGARCAQNVKTATVALESRTFSFSELQFLEAKQTLTPSFRWNSNEGHWDSWIVILKNIVEKRLSNMRDGKMVPNEKGAEYLRFTLEASWSDSIGNQYTSSSEATYEYSVQKCRTRPGIVVRKANESSIGF
jgi:hypothetical protein